MRCPQCELMVINGVVCHESGCPVRAAEKKAEAMEDLEVEA